MSKDFFDYHGMMENALRGVARAALIRASERGLPGNHHFYISFRTGAPGVSVPEYLQARYPDEMTIVIQHQFWGLDVEESKFAITLSFNRMQERLIIPFAALTAFADPSVPFGLQFRGGATARESQPAGQIVSSEPVAEPLPTEAKMGEVVALDTFRKK